jgi:uncharacterized protein (UPF0332 family)
MPDDPPSLLRKALEALAGAESEFANARYNNCANRCYYSCYQAAVAVLLRSGIRPRGSNGQWSHEFVIAQIDGELINRRKRLPSALRGTLHRMMTVRVKADYEDDDVSHTEASRVLRRCRDFVEVVQTEGGRAP